MIEQTYKLPPDCVLRPARASDIWAIRKLVLFAKLDPTQIRWSQFWVIECQNRVVACGQLRNFSGAQELGSLVVDSAWRGRGLGRYLVKHLIQVATEPLYLECLGSQLAEFYTRFGFVPIAWQKLPPPLKRKFGVSQLATRFLPMLDVTIMQYQETELS
jgi:amino-acid N-acetyltransferase